MVNGGLANQRTRQRERGRPIPYETDDPTMRQINLHWCVLERPVVGDDLLDLSRQPVAAGGHWR
jgi:hypothetical protein